ncbi:hypothetical protein L9F63_002351 [Diploptera punctata]|uniref:Uncharacterized protein n=1 Tax=Diploptera punctata TaxID=6984 RepID=A0AAD8EHU1_DIPPU|nr:hypothetical protein L9F63_002351 [Diploptera punctata]
MEDLFLTLGFVMCYWEGAYMKIKKEHVWRIFGILDSKPLPNVRNNKLKEIHIKDIKEVMSQCKFISWFIFLSVNVGTLMWAIFPLVNLTIHKFSENSEQEDDELRKANKPWPYLMYIIWVPYDATTMPMYAVTYAIQVLVYFTASLYNTASNIVFINLILHATGKFKIVESSFLFIEEILRRNKSTYGRKMDKIYRDEEISIEDGENDLNNRIDMQNIDDFPSNEEISIDKRIANTEMEHFLIECIKQHQEAIA